MKIYTYDGSFDGLLTAVFYAYKEKDSVKIIKETAYIPDLFSEKITVATESDKSDRVYQGIENNLSCETLTNIYYVYLSNLAEAETLILEYIKLCFKHSDKINLAKNNDVIRMIDKYKRKVFGEAHLFQGLIRFKEIAPLVYYAQIEPDHNILPLIMGHFKRRFSDQHFVIHDLKREYAVVYDLHGVYLRDLSAEEGEKFQSLSKTDPFEALFKCFYESVTIAERLNKRQQSSYMPRRYWKHLVEL